MRLKRVSTSRERVDQILEIIHHLLDLFLNDNSQLRITMPPKRKALAATDDNSVLAPVAKRESTGKAMAEVGPTIPE